MTMTPEQIRGESEELAARVLSLGKAVATPVAHGCCETCEAAGREEGAERERAASVAYLRDQPGVLYGAWAQKLASEIERGAHLAT